MIKETQIPIIQIGALIARMYFNGNPTGWLYSYVHNPKATEPDANLWFILLFLLEAPKALAKDRLDLTSQEFSSIDLNALPHIDKMRAEDLESYCQKISDVVYFIGKRLAIRNARTEQHTFLEISNNFLEISNNFLATCKEVGISETKAV